MSAAPQLELTLDEALTEMIVTKNLDDRKAAEALLQHFGVEQVFAWIPDEIIALLAKRAHDISADLRAEIKSNAPGAIVKTQKIANLIGVPMPKATLVANPWLAPCPWNRGFVYAQLTLDKVRATRKSIAHSIENYEHGESEMAAIEDLLIEHGTTSVMELVKKGVPFPKV